MRIGMGYDIHRLQEGRKMVLGGVAIDHPKGPYGHSDGDVLLHAVCDAILGAIGEPDIGQMFPDTDPKYKDADSLELLKTVADLMDSKGFKVSNLDSVIVLEEPKIAPHKGAISEKIKDILRLEEGCVSIKGKTHEKLGEIGKGNAVAAYAVVLLVKK